MRDQEIIPNRDLPAKEKTEFKDRQLEMGLEYLKSQIRTAVKPGLKKPAEARSVSLIVKLSSDPPAPTGGLYFFQFGFVRLKFHGPTSSRLRKAHREGVMMRYSRWAVSAALAVGCQSNPYKPTMFGNVPERSAGRARAGHADERGAVPRRRVASRDLPRSGRADLPGQHAPARRHADVPGIDAAGHARAAGPDRPAGPGLPAAADRTLAVHAARPPSAHDQRKPPAEACHLRPGLYIQSESDRPGMARVTCANWRHWAAAASGASKRCSSNSAAWIR